jgi:hypothetical protein
MQLKKFSHLGTGPCWVKIGEPPHGSCTRMPRKIVTYVERKGIGSSHWNYRTGELVKRAVYADTAR